MGTPAMLFGALASSAIASCTAFVLSVLIISRTVVFFDTWLQASLAQQEDAWLRGQCRVPEFLARMQHHDPSLCSRVESTPPSTPFQAALNAAAARPSAIERACGNNNCMDALVREWQSATGKADSVSLWRYAGLALAWLVLFNLLLWLARRILERLPMDRRKRRAHSLEPPRLELRTRAGRKPPPPPLSGVQIGHCKDI